MAQILLIGVGAGVASALLSASVASGSLISLVLTAFAQLPILIAAIGWTSLAGLIAVLVASAAVGFIFGALSGFMFVISVALPAWWIGYLVLLARPAESAEPGTLEWYPVGRIVVWSAIVSAAVVAVWLLRYGADLASVRTALRREIDLFFRLLVALRISSLSDAERTREALVLIVPGMKAVGFTLISLLNVWLAALIVKVSGRLRRPWPKIAQMTFPPFAPAALATAAGAIFLPELLGLIGSIFTASLLLAYALLGFAMVHFVTLGIAGRGAMLTGLYFTAVVFSWPVLLVMCVLGLIETMLSLRARVAASRPPPGSTNFS